MGRSVALRIQAETDGSQSSSLYVDDVSFQASTRLAQASQWVITATDVTVVSSTQITCDFDLTGAVPGLWNVVVTNPDAQSGTLPDGFTVYAKAPAGVTIAGSETGLINIPYNFVATLSQATVVLPMTYRWEASGRPPVTHTAGLSDTVSFSWSTAGRKAVTVTVSNPAGSISATHAISISGERPDIEVSPTSFEETVGRGARLTRTLTISNTGADPFVFTIGEGVGGFIPLRGPTFTGSRVVSATVALSLDDGTQESALVLSESDTLTEYRAVLFNRFEAAEVAGFPLTLQRVDIHQSTENLQGLPIQLLVYTDADGGDPSNATLRYSEIITVHTEMGWNSYTLAHPVFISNTTDVLIGFSTYYADGGVSWPEGARYPYPMDTTDPQAMSYLAFMEHPSDPVDPADLSSLTYLTELTSIDRAANWMIRGYGALGSEVDVPWLSEVPTSGTVLVGGATPVDIVFDAERLMPGDYTASLLVNSDAPGERPVPVSVTLHVMRGMGITPIAVDDVYTTVRNTPLAVAAPGVLGNDIDIDGDPLTATLDAGPSHGVLSLSGDGAFNYTPSAGFAGLDTFTYYASDGIFSDTATVYITVTEVPANIAVTPSSLSATLAPGERATEGLLISNIGTAPLTFEIREQASGVRSAREMPFHIQQSPDRDLAGSRIPQADAALTLDDGTQEDGLIIRNPDTLTEYRVVLFNRFDAVMVPGFPLTLERIDIHQESNNLQGEQIQLLVYTDADGSDPSDAVLQYSEIVTVQTGDGWNSYTLADPVVIASSTDILIGFSTYYADGGVPWPENDRYPYPLDTTSPQGKSYLAFMENSSDPVDPSDLSSFSALFELTEIDQAANWMIRGYGSLDGTSDVPWLSETPTSGTVLAGGALPVDVVFDATGLALGDYTANLIISSNDPNEPSVPVPVTLHVTTTEVTQVTVSVSGNQYCSGRTSGVKRCFEVDTAASMDATVRFYFSEAERDRQALRDIRAFRYSGGWVEEPGPYNYGGTGDAQYIEVQNVAALGPGTRFALSAEDGGSTIYMPWIMRHWPPIPATPTLDAIDNADDDGNYTVRWSAANRAQTYILEEDDNLGFSSPTTRYNSTGLSWSASNKTAGAYYYRVKAHNSWGDSSWSNVRSVSLRPPNAPVLSAISNSDCNGNYTVRWSAVDRAQTYTLQEDDNTAFSSPSTRYTGSGTYKSITGKSPGTYYYRVRASNAIGHSNWSNVHSVKVCRPQSIVYVNNRTGGQLCYEVNNTGIGRKCFSSGTHYYGTFPVGTYSWRASARCGSASGSRYYSSGEWTHEFWCGARTSSSSTFQLQSGE
jgi:hypothetical protein